MACWAVTSPDAAMRTFLNLPSSSLSEARARLSAGFTQHVTIALTACVLALIFG
jgi:hypothetical protein